MDCLIAEENSILSTTGQAISWDENGLRLRKWNSDRTGYADEQIWMKDNLIVFTEDAWEHAKMAIGHIHDDELGDLWGVVADNLVGKMVAGENLYIHSTKPDGGQMYFKVDGAGMRSWNAHQVWEKDDWGIAIDPAYGLFMNDGTNPLYKTVGDKQVPWCCNNDGSLRLKKDSAGDTYRYPDGANIWIGLDGNAYFRGNIYADNGIFKGELKAATGSFKGELNAATIKAATITGKIESDGNGKIVGPEICVPDEYGPKFHVDSDGNTTITDGTFSAPEINGGTITGTNIYAGDGSGSYAHMAGDGLMLYAGGVPLPKVKIDAGWDGKQPQIVLGAGDGNWNSQVFTMTKNQTQGILSYSGPESNWCGFAFNSDSTVFPVYGTKMTGTWDFTNAEVKGITVVLA